MPSDTAGAPSYGVKRALLLQGPNGPFFRRLQRELRRRGTKTFKIDFNTGDAFFQLGRPSRAFRGRIGEWPAYLERTLRREQIDGVFLFGDGRPYHRLAIEVAERLGIDVFVFEEGYLRPDWITLEKGGVNGHSRMPRDAALFRRLGAQEPLRAPATHVGQTFRYSAWYATVYACAAALGWPFFPHYSHHRSINPLEQAYRWVRGGLRKLVCTMREAGIQTRLAEHHDQHFFLVPLQVYCDYQLVHSPFANVETFIEQVMGSFAEHAPSEDLLVIKHHPMDRPYRDYTKLIRARAKKLGIAERVLYIHDQHLPTLLAHARGTVMINSTVGLQAALQGTPVKVLGTAVYDMPGITHQGSLAEFWHAPEPIDREVVSGFRAYLLTHNQVNGNFFKRLPGIDTPTGMRWER